MDRVLWNWFLALRPLPSLECSLQNTQIDVRRCGSCCRAFESWAYLQHKPISAAHSEPHPPPQSLPSQFKPHKHSAKQLNWNSIAAALPCKCLFYWLLQDGDTCSTQSRACRLPLLVKRERGRQSGRPRQQDPGCSAEVFLWRHQQVRSRRRPSGILDGAGSDSSLLLLLKGKSVIFLYIKKKIK